MGRNKDRQTANDDDALDPPRLRLAVAAHPVSDPGAGWLEGDAALDALLEEYVAMLAELRGSTRVPASSLREDDLAELARVVGATPEAIETRLTELLETRDSRVHPGT